jgi:two-component system, NtrC family, C4-dicarboxylate transport sensor histidine kinase DctB
MNPPKSPSSTNVDEQASEMRTSGDAPSFPPPAAASPYAERLAALQADNERLRDMLAAAGRLAEFGRFAAKQNHELRQPLFAIKGLAQLLLDRNQVDVDEVRDFARHIVEQSERLTRLVADLRHVSMPAPQTGQRSVDVSPLLLRMASLLDWRFRKGVTLRTELAADLPPVAVSPHELEQVLINLLSNALDAVAGRPTPIIQVRVNVRVRPSERGPEQGGMTAGRRFVEISVADNGHGVPRTARERLFDNFFTTKGEEAGTGLGLAVSREIARGAGGNLELLETPGAWTEAAVTVFQLTLPAATDRTHP